MYLICTGAAGRFTLEAFLGAATILSCMDKEQWRLNNGVWMTPDFIGRYRGRGLNALKQSRVFRWLFEHDRLDAFEFVGEVGTIDLVPEVVVGGRLRRADEPERSPPLKMSGAG